MPFIKNPLTVVKGSGGVEPVGTEMEVTAQSVINAGEFVRLNESIIASTKLSSASGSPLAIIALDEKRFVYIASNYYASVLTKNDDGAFTQGAEVSLTNVILDAELVLLSNNKVALLTHRQNTSNVYARVLTISGETITVGTDYYAAPCVESAKTSSWAATAVSSSTLLIANSPSASSAAIIAASISGGTITLGNNVSITTLLASKVLTMGVCSASESSCRVWYGISGAVYCAAFTCSGRVITLGTTSQPIKSGSTGSSAYGRIGAMVINGNFYAFCPLLADHVFIARDVNDSLLGLGTTTAYGSSYMYRGYGKLTNDLIYAAGGVYIGVDRNYIRPLQTGTVSASGNVVGCTTPSGALVTVYGSSSPYTAASYELRAMPLSTYVNPYSSTIAGIATTKASGWQKVKITRWY